MEKAIELHSHRIALHRLVFALILLEPVNELSISNGFICVSIQCENNSIPWLFENRTKETIWFFQDQTNEIHTHTQPNIILKWETNFNSQSQTPNMTKWGNKTNCIQHWNHYWTRENFLHFYYFFSSSDLVSLLLNWLNLEFMVNINIAWVFDNRHIRRQQTNCTYLFNRFEKWLSGMRT